MLTFSLDLRCAESSTNLLSALISINDYSLLGFFTRTFRVACTAATIVIGTIPERAPGRLKSMLPGLADGVRCEGRGAVILRRNYPLPESSAGLAFFWGACSGV